MGESITLSIVEPHFAKSKTAFLSLTGGKSSIFFSKFLSRAIGMVEGHHIGFYAKENDDSKKFIWGIFLTNNTLQTSELKRSKPSDMFRINDKKIAELIQGVFRIKKHRTIRVYVNFKNPIEFMFKGEKVQVYMLYDIPTMREDLEEEEQQQYNEEYIKSMVSLKGNYGINND